jgi:DNA polymerase III beta subunit, N-terminal domain
LLRKGGDYLNVTINRAEMLCAIKRASAIAPADSPLDVLRGVLLEADAAAGKLTVTSTNLEAALEEKLPCTVQEDGALVFGAKMLAEMLSRLPQDTVQLCRAENQGRMTLRSGDACYEVDVWERGAFPKPDLPFPEDTVKLSGIPAMAQHTVFATAQDNSKPLLKCVNLMFTSTGLRAAGSNGNCIVTARGDNQSTGDVSLLIPAASLGKLSNMCQDKDEFRVGTTGKSIVFFRENFLFSARLMEGGYIDTDQLVGSIRNAFTVLTDIHDMRAALSSVLSIGTGNRVKLSFQDQRLVFQCAGDCVSASAPIEVIALTGAPAGDYWFNAKQLVTCLKALSGTVTLGIAQGGMLTLATQDAYYLQSAMRPEAQKKTQKAAQPAAAKAA